MCTSCRVEVVQGMENLTELTQNEKDQTLASTERIVCQCKIKKGIVKIRIA